MKTITNLILATSGFLAMFDLTKVAFETCEAPNVFISIGRVLIELTAGCAGYIVCFGFLLFLESFLESSVDALMKKLGVEEDI